MKCRKCGTELDLSGFEEDEDGNQVELYACRTEGCPKNTDQIQGEGDA